MQPALRIAHRASPGGVRVVVVLGEADMDTTGQLQAALRKAVAARQPRPPWWWTAAGWSSAPRPG
ncbi:hypothetical protein ACFQ1I_02210 [Kitasatospora arboriphila]